MLKFWQAYQQQLALALSVLLLLIIVLGKIFNWSYSVKLLPIVLAILAVLALLVWAVPSRQKVLLSIAILVLSFLVGIVLVHSISFVYGEIIGLKLLGVPVIIGILWFLITLSAWHIIGFGNLSEAKKFMLAGLLVLMLNLLLNQFAAAYNLWDWDNNRTLFINNAVNLGMSELIFYLYYRFTKLFSPSSFIASLLPLMALFFWLMLL